MSDLERTAIVWRHGRTAWNLAARFQGQLDVALDDVGQRQAAAAAHVLAEFNPDLIVTSTLTRAVDTAAALGALTGTATVTDADLRETHAGAWQGLTHAQIEAEDPAGLAAWRSGEDVRPGGTGETRAEVGRRVAAAVSRHMMDADPGSTAVFVTHGGAARAGMGLLLGLESLEWPRLSVLGNCAWSVLGAPDPLRSQHWQLQAHNVTVRGHSRQHPLHSRRLPDPGAGGVAGSMGIV